MFEYPVARLPKQCNSYTIPNWEFLFCHFSSFFSFFSLYLFCTSPSLSFFVSHTLRLRLQPTSCPFDFVKVYDGPDNSSELIGTYCGQQRNLVLYSSKSSLLVHFFTLRRTASTQNRGFKGIYEFSEGFVKLDFICE